MNRPSIFGRRVVPLSRGLVAAVVSACRSYSDNFQHGSNGNDNCEPLEAIVDSADDASISSFVGH